MQRQNGISGSACILLAFAGFLAPSSLLAGNPQLHISPVQPTLTTNVSFSAPYLGPVTQEALSQISPRTVLSDNKLFYVTIDAGSFSRNKANDFQFDIYVQKAGASGAESFRVSEGPQGIFTDYLASVPVTIEMASVTDTATVPGIPIHAQYEGPIFSLGDGAPFNVKLGGSSSNPIPLTSNLTGLEVDISDVKVASTACSGCWLAQPTATTDSIVQPKDSASLNLTLQPNNLYALFESAFSLNPSQAHDVLAVTITSTPGQKGLPVQQKIVVPVRFTPDAIYLALAVLLGSLIGFGIRRLIPASASDDAAPAEPALKALPRWGRDLLLSVATAALVEVAGLILYKPPTTSIVIFGFSLDPTQFAPTLLIAILVAGGPPVVSRISQAIKL